MLTPGCSHNADEGLLFTSPFIQNNSVFADLVVQDLPTVAAYPQVLDYITNTLYRTYRAHDTERGP